MKTAQPRGHACLRLGIPQVLSRLMKEARHRAPRELKSRLASGQVLEPQQEVRVEKAQVRERDCRMIREAQRTASLDQQTKLGLPDN